MYKTINGYTKQDIIDRINTKFKGKAMTNDEMSCTYLNDYGQKCAVGLFIPDVHHYAATSLRLVIGLLEDFPELNAYMPLEKNGLAEFQRTHDTLSTSDSIETQKEKLIEWVNEKVE